MNATALRTVLQHALGHPSNGPAIADDELLHRFASSGDQAAFAVLVGRHGPMVWGVCRNLLPDESDADDAFQATFLTLLRSAATIRDRSLLAGWLHRVAYRVAMKTRRAAVRRRQREKTVAVREATTTVADSSWDQFLGAVHEEVNLLPDSLRVPFVLCCFEGRRVTEVAVALGWKLGTLSARVTRAKQRLLDRLAQRGLPAAAVAGVAALATTTSSASVPLALFDKTVALCGALGSVSPAVVHLSLGVLEMKLTRTLCITVALLTAGVLATIGPALAPSASAQQGPKTPAVLQNADPSHAQPAGKAPPKWEFGYVEAPRPLSEASFESVCRKMEPQGWEYCGSQEMTLDRTPLPKGATKSGPTLVLVFKRSAHPQDGKRSERAESVRQLELLGFDVERAQDAEKLAHLEKEKLRHLRMDAELLQKALDQLTGKQAALAEREKAEADRLTKDAQAARDKDGRLSRLPATEPLIKEGQARVVLGEIQLPLSEGANSNKASAESIQIIPLGIEASAPKLAKILTELFGKQGTFQADERSNSLIVKADDKTKEEVQKLLDRLEKQAVIKKQRDKEELEKMIRRK